MITGQDLRALAREIAARHEIDQETAWRYANLIGDTPETDDDENIIIRDENSEIIATLAIPFW